ncbi:hypothetical protein [Phaeodactylibacter xiamenensis]|uniref:hypothetical protein n=1 Tax=Phaeodactylibacter xiamenensis TaxID=1524460 RepID=UPI003CCC040B
MDQKYSIEDIEAYLMGVMPPGKRAVFEAALEKDEMLQIQFEQVKKQVEVYRYLRKQALRQKFEIWRADGTITPLPSKADPVSDTSTKYRPWIWTGVVFLLLAILGVIVCEMSSAATLTNEKAEEAQPSKDTVTKKRQFPLEVLADTVEINEAQPEKTLPPDTKVQAKERNVPIAEIEEKDNKLQLEVKGQHNQFMASVFNVYRASSEEADSMETSIQELYNKGDFETLSSIVPDSMHFLKGIVLFKTGTYEAAAQSYLAVDDVFRKHDAQYLALLSYVAQLPNNCDAYMKLLKEILEEEGHSYMDRVEELAAKVKANRLCQD